MTKLPKTIKVDVELPLWTAIKLRIAGAPLPRFKKGYISSYDKLMARLEGEDEIN